MPLGFEKVSSNQFFVPKGPMRIAQRFSVGNPSPSDFVPKGGLRRSSASAVPLGLLTFYCLVPNAEALGYSQPSLRDALQILVALPVSGAAGQDQARTWEKVSARWCTNAAYARGRSRARLHSPTHVAAIA